MKKKKKRASATQQGQNPKLLAAVFKISFRNLMSFNFPKVGLAMPRHQPTLNYIYHARGNGPCTVPWRAESVNYVKCQARISGTTTVGARAPHGLQRALICKKKNSFTDLVKDELITCLFCARWVRGKALGACRSVSSVSTYIGYH
jgi:hypothetical protein